MFKKLLVAGSALTLSAFSNAAVDFSQLTSGVDFSSASTAVIGIAVAIAGVYVAIAGARAVLRMIKGA